MTVHYVLGDGFFHSAAVGDLPPDAQDGDVFALLADHASLGIGQMSDTATFIYSNNDTIGMSYPTGPNTIVDQGQGTAIFVNEPVSAPSLQHVISVFGFQNDPTATLHIDDWSWWRTPQPAPLIQSDGRGGSLIGNSSGQFFVDLIGDPSPNPAQLSVYRAYA